MKKDVLFIIPTLCGGGAEKVLIDILRNFDYDQYAVSIALEFKEGVYLDDVPDNVEISSFYGGYNVFFYAFFTLLRKLRLYHFFHKTVYRYWLRSIYKNKTFDTIVSFMEGNALRLHSYIFDKAKCNVSWVHLDLKAKHWSADFFETLQTENECYKSLDHVVFVSNDSMNKFLELYPDYPKSKCMVIYNLIDKERIASLSQEKRVEKQGFVICMVGRLNEQKRYDRAIKAVEKLKEDGYKFELWILGTGEKLETYQQRCLDIGLGNHVRFLGFVKPAYAYMRPADIFLNTSSAEGYPLTICEALCLGLPVVATNITGAREILDDSNYGVLVEEDVDDIYKGVKELMDSPDKRVFYKRKALERAEMFSVDYVMNEIYEMLNGK